MSRLRQQQQSLEAANIRLTHYASTLEQLATSRERNRLALEMPEIIMVPPLSPDVEQCIYRVAQEAVTNVVKHASAKKLTVELEFIVGKTMLIVRDDGVWPAPQTQPATLITSKLTDREIEVLRLLAKGLNNKDISDQLFLSEGTVRNHVSAILAKLGASDRTQAAVIAIQHGLSDSLI